MEVDISFVLIIAGVCWYIGMFLQRLLDKMDRMKVCPHCGEDLRVNYKKVKYLN